MTQKSEYIKLNSICPYSIGTLKRMNIVCVAWMGIIKKKTKQKTNGAAAFVIPKL